jgi:hypothetical protein
MILACFKTTRWFDWFAVHLEDEPLGFGKEEVMVAMDRVSIERRISVGIFWISPVSRHVKFWQSVSFIKKVVQENRLLKNCGHERPL